MSQPKLLKRVTAALDALGIEYMLTGSYASSMQGEPRSTHDIDFVVVLSEADAERLASALPAPAFYLDVDAAKASVRGRGMFNLVECDSGDKVDFWLLKPEPYDRERFARRARQQILGIDAVAVSRPEDTILQKLRWTRQLGGSEKHFGDALRVYEVQQGGLELAYIERWAAELGVEALWARVLDEAEPL